MSQMEQISIMFVNNVNLLVDEQVTQLSKGCFANLTAVRFTRLIVQFLVSVLISDIAECCFTNLTNNRLLDATNGMCSCHVRAQTV